MSNRRFLIAILIAAGIAPSLVTANTGKKYDEGSLQKIVDKEIDREVICTSPRMILVLVADPMTGEILAVATRGVSSTHQMACRRAISFTYNPGSTLKVFPKSAREKAHLVGLVTPLEMLMGYCAIANGGILRPPHLSLEYGPLTGRRILSEKTAARLSESLRQGVTESNSFKLARVKGMEIAGSAGHSQERGWLGIPRGSTASFIGFFPAHKAQFVCLVLVQDAHVLPKYNRGALVAAPCFSNTAEKVGTLLE